MTETQSDIFQKIKDTLEKNQTVLFMKGTPAFPQCGFSARAVAILRELNVDFFAVNILEDAQMRQGIKDYGNWPTIPQLYFKSELIGGSDIMMEMFESGELQELFGAEQA